MEKEFDLHIKRAKVFSKKEISDDTFEFIFSFSEPFNYIPGQYVWVKLLDVKAEDNRGERRAFSITSFPDGSNNISIVSRATDSGFHKLFRRLEAGAPVEIIGPFGYSFCLPEDPNIPLVFIAGGSGLTPFLSVFRYSIAKKLGRPITVINVNNPGSRQFYEEEIQSFATLPNNFKFINVAGLMSEEYLKAISNLKESLIYVAGPQGFIDHVHKLLIAGGVDPGKIHFEQFYPGSTEDKEIKELFENGLPRIFPDMPRYIQQQFKMLYTLIDTSGSHMVVTDANGYILFANKAAQRITGFAMSEMLGNTPRLWGGLMDRDFYDGLWKAKIRGEVVDTEVINRRKNGELYVAAAHISPFRNSDGKVIGFVATEEDITEIKNKEKELTQRTEEAERLSRLAVDRELKMIELKNEIKSLSGKDK